MPHPLLAPMQTEFDALRRGAAGPAAFSRHARAQAELLAVLPPRYAEVLHGLADRLESSALFAEESCSFSQGMGCSTRTMRVRIQNGMI